MEKPHKKLDVWKASMELAVVIYRLTSKFPAEEKFGLIGQATGGGKYPKQYCGGRSQAGQEGI